MFSTTDIAPFVGTVGGGFFLGLITEYAIKNVIKLAAIIADLFIAALAYLEYQRIVSEEEYGRSGRSSNKCLPEGCRQVISK